jgi:hypothetical protein
MLYEDELLLRRRADITLPSRHEADATGGVLITSKMDHMKSASIFIDRSQSMSRTGVSKQLTVYKQDKSVSDQLLIADSIQPTVFVSLHRVVA